MGRADVKRTEVFLRSHWLAIDLGDHISRANISFLLGQDLGNPHPAVSDPEVACGYLR